MTAAVFEKTDTLIKDTLLVSVTKKDDQTVTCKQVCEGRKAMLLSKETIPKARQFVLFHYYLNPNPLPTI